VLGIEPALNIAALAEADGVPTVAEFFTERAADRLRGDHGAAGAILARHVFAHVDDVHDFLRGVDRLLAPDGVLILEVHYVGALLRHLEFDTIYHEHLSYFALGPMERLAADHGFLVTDAEVIPMHGGSLLVSLQRKGAAAVATPAVEQLRRDEAARAVGAPNTLAAFARDVATWKERFEALIADLAGGGAVLAAYGAAAKGNTLLNYCPDVAARLRYILDRSPHKRGRLAPGSHLPVRDAVGWEPDGTTHVLLLAWNFKEEIIRQMRAFAERGGKFVVPIPRPEVL
jgi:novobiocin biosynthesis protein NovU/D-mycarose 3-C-methyltransferase